MAPMRMGYRLKSLAKKEPKKLSCTIFGMLQNITNNTIRKNNLFRNVIDIYSSFSSLTVSLDTNNRI